MKNKMNRYMLSTFLISSLVVAQTSKAQNYANYGANQSAVNTSTQNVSLNDIKSVLYKELDRRLITLSRTVHLYHYFQWKAPVGPKRNVDLKHNLFQNYFRGELGQFWMENPSSSGMAGPGLYAAIDPQASASYGETMLEVGLKKGARILDLGSPIAYSDQLKDLIARYQQLKKADTVGYSTLSMFDISQFSATSMNTNTTYSVDQVKKIKESLDYQIVQLVKDYVAKNKVVGIAYGWSTYISQDKCTKNSRLGINNVNSYFNYYSNSNLNTPPGQRSPYSRFRGVAFILMGSASSAKGAKDGQVGIPSTLEANVVTDTPGDLKGEKKRVYDRVKRIKQIIGSYGYYYGSNQQSSVLTAEDQQLLSDNIFGCDEKYKEDMND